MNKLTHLLRIIQNHSNINCLKNYKMHLTQYYCHTLSLIRRFGEMFLMK